MTTQRVQLMLMEEGSGRRCGALRVAVAPDRRVGVRDLSSRAIIEVRAADISVYRHTVMLRGRAFRVLNVLH